MSTAEKLARTALAPLVPPVRLWRMRRAARRVPGGLGAPVRAWLLIPVYLATHAAGEAVGYWRLVRDVEAKYERFELHRIACIRADERHLMTAARPGAEGLAAPLV